MALLVKNPPAIAGLIRNSHLIPGWGGSPGGWHSHPLQYSCLENPLYRGAWQATVHRVAKSWTWLRQLSTHACTQVEKDSGYLARIAFLVSSIASIQTHTHPVFSSSAALGSLQVIVIYSLYRNGNYPRIILTYPASLQGNPMKGWVLCTPSRQRCCEVGKSCFLSLYLDSFQPSGGSPTLNWETSILISAPPWAKQC